MESGKITAPNINKNYGRHGYIMNYCKTENLAAVQTVTHWPTYYPVT
jgi:Zn/Cd-binding protein ZinT